MIQRLQVMRSYNHMTKKQILMKETTCKMKNFYILPAFSLITTVLLTAVSI